MIDIIYSDNYINIEICTVDDYNCVQGMSRIYIIHDHAYAYSAHCHVGCSKYAYIEFPAIYLSLHYDIYSDEFLSSLCNGYINISMEVVIRILSHIQKEILLKSRLSTGTPSKSITTILIKYSSPFYHCGTESGKG